MTSKQTEWEKESDKLNEQFNAVKEGRTFPATIRDIQQTTAAEVFGNDCENPDSAVIVCTVELDEGDKFSETYSLPKTAGSWTRENFKLGKFARKYGAVPHIGQKVEVFINKDNFYRVLI